MPLIDILRNKKLEHELPNKNGVEYNRGYVKAMNDVLNILLKRDIFTIKSDCRGYDSVKLSCINNGQFYQMDDIKSITIKEEESVLIVSVNKFKPF